MKIIAKTGRTESVAGRALWGVVTGAAAIFDGTVSILTLGVYHGDLQWSAALWLVKAEARAHQAKESIDD
jgi:hypothetical protein